MPIATATDGTWIWNTGMQYYVRVHGMRPEDEFLEHIVSCGYQARTPTPDEGAAAYAALLDAQARHRSDPSDAGPTREPRR